jgi:thioredoxin reductase
MPMARAISADMSLRTAMPGIAREGEAFDFAFEGEAVRAWPGETVMAALVADGRLAMREARDGGLRGPYCGMGVCGECSVLVDGIQRRACMTAARADADVRRMPALAPATGTGAVARQAVIEHAPDLLVIGAGPAGLAAARTAAGAGLDVLVLDERASAGGQYFKQPAKGFAIDGDRIDAQFAEGRALTQAAVAAGARILNGASVWSALPGGEIGFVHDGAAHRAVTRQIIVATGGYERPHVMPGWTLPGVMTTGAAQTLLRAYQVAPGQRVLVAGNGPLNLQVARELLRAGVEVVAVAEAASAPGIGNLGDALAMAATAPGLVRDGIGHLLALRRAGVPLFHRHALTRAEGEDRVRRGQVMRIDAGGWPVAGSERWFDVDAICCGYGFLPQGEIARAMGAGVDGEGQIARGDDGTTDIEGLRVIGDAAAMGGARIALAQGVLAGAAVVAEAGGKVDPLTLSHARQALAAHRRFQAALWRIYAAPRFGMALAEADTLVCRCESVPRSAVDAAIGGGAESVGAIKRLSRLGMGRCQGRYCGALLAERLAVEGIGPDGDPGFAPRPPFRPVANATVALGDR